MVLTKEQKKLKILEYLDKEAKLKEFKVEKFTIDEISIYLKLGEDEVNELLEELIQEKSVYKDQFVYDVFLPEGDYKYLEDELTNKYTPLGMNHISRFLTGIIIIWVFGLLTMQFINYGNLLLDFSKDPISLLVGLILFVVLIYFMGAIANKIYIKILMKYETLRDITTKIKPLIFTGLIIWIIMLIPFGCMYYFFDEQNLIYAMIYLFVTFPTTILASVGVQDYLTRKKTNGEKKN